MPDSSRSFDPLPLDWGDAFDRLPLAAPPASAWPRMAQALQARARRRTQRRAMAMAMAAALAAMVAAPVLVLRMTDVPDVATVAVDMPKAAAATAAIVRRPASAQAGVGPAAAPTDDARAPGRPDARAAGTGHEQDGARVGASPASMAAMPMALRAAGRRRQATSGTSMDADPRRDDGAAVAAASVADVAASTLATLQAESAQLEHVLELARDEDVAAGMDVLVGDAQLERVASIDAALADAGPAARIALWQARVAALREAAAFEGARRWRGAQGLSLDDAVVRVD